MKSLYALAIRPVFFSMIALFLLSVGLSSCKEYLDAKPDKALEAPNTIADYQSLLDNTALMNETSPSWNMASADNYYLPPGTYNAPRIGDISHDVYRWIDHISSGYGSDWYQIYEVVYYTNVILDKNGISTIEQDGKNEVAWKNVKGSALFFRAFQFLRAAFIFSKAYDENTADKDYGIVLRTTSDFNAPSRRASVKETYDKIIHDLEEAIPLLPIEPKHVMRPSRPAAYALLARTYLSMRKYDSCFKYVNLCLKLKSDLMDYNVDVDTSSQTQPISQFNKEVIFSSTVKRGFPIFPTSAAVDSNLYHSYDENDLRKEAFFLISPRYEGIRFKGTYNGNFSSLFVGVATDEVWLMRAECYARLGNRDAALFDLNTLMAKRWKSGTFVPFSAPTAQDALQLILKERRKELIFRGLRWMDLKRLNKEGANITLKRVVEGKTYTLPPNDPRYTQLIPDDIIQMTGMPQNIR